MNIHSSLFLLGALGVLSGPGVAVAAVDTSQWKCETCPYPKGASGEVDIGVGVVSDESARFGTDTGLHRKGGHLLLGGTATVRGDGGLWADFGAADLGLDRRTIAARGGREGVYTLSLDYAELPTWRDEGARTPFLGNGGTVLTPPAGYPAATTGTMPLAATLQTIAPGFKHRRLGLGGEWQTGGNWRWRVQVRHDVRDGTRSIYGSFFSTASQLAWPVDQVTDRLEVSGSFGSRRLQATLGYQFSQFRNQAETLTWDNPFGPVVAGSNRGQLALAPDNQAHRIFGAASYELGATMRLSGDFGVGRLTQDAAFLAPTLTPALAATVPALPGPSLDGRVDTFDGNIRFSAAPIDGLRLNATYSRNVRDNRTAVRSYPHVATDIFLAPAPVSNTPHDHFQDRFKVQADYRASDAVKVAAGIDQDNRERSYQEVLTTRETTVWARFGVVASEHVSLSLKLAKTQRDHSSYGVANGIGAPENPLLRKYNLADRDRDSASLRADITFGEGLTLGIDADIAVDDYSRSVVGLNQGRSSGAGADLSAPIGEKTQLQVFLRSDWVRSRQTGSVSFGQPDWWARSKDASELFGIGLRHAAIEDKLDLGADLALMRTRSHVAVETLVASPPFPRASTSTDSLRLFATWRLSEKMSLTGDFWHERYRSQDWQLDGIQPSTLPNLLSYGVQPPQYRVNVVRLVLRYGF